MSREATVTTRQTRLNVRSGPSISTSIIGKLNKGQAITIGDQTVSEGGWTWVDYNGGWVCQKDPRYSYPFLNIVVPPAETEPAPAEPAPAPVTPNYDDITASLLSQFGSNNINVPTGQHVGIDGSAVQYEDSKYQADELDINKNWQANKNRGAMSADELRRLDRKSPEYYQNKLGYPPIERFDYEKGYYIYNYAMNYDRDNLSSDLPGLRHTFNLGIESRDQLYRQYTEYYNRFKLANPNDTLSKTFSHVFFVRPDCNVLTRRGSGWVLPSEIQDDANFYYAWKKSPELLRQLVNDAGYGHDFMMYLSNKARSFQLNDEYINYDTYGKAFTGHKVVYGKTNVESKTAGDFSIQYEDDRDLHVYTLHKLWADYISNVYQGTFNPKTEYIRDRILDYVANVYYFLCAEDGETIIFWSKYYGVFPVTIPSSQYSWAAGNTLSNPEIDIKYQYSFKEDFNPLSIVEFNMNSGDSHDYDYMPIISKDGYTVNTTWVGAPFIETFNDGFSAPYTLKLRFRKGNIR